MTNTPFALDRREFIALAGGLAAVLVIGDGAYFASRRSAAHAQPVPSESGTLTQPETPLNGTIASPNAEAPFGRRPLPRPSQQPQPIPKRLRRRSKTSLEPAPREPRASPRRRLRARQPGRVARRKLGGAPRQPPGGRPHRRRSHGHAHGCRGRRAHIPSSAPLSAPTTTRRISSKTASSGPSARSIWKAPKPRRPPHSGLPHRAPASTRPVSPSTSWTLTTWNWTRARKRRPQQWLMIHCAEYGFILRYPTDKSATTGIGYEPGTTATSARRPPPP